MSKPIRFLNPAERPVSAMPTTPPAGPDRIASLPRNRSAAVRPPDDIMNIRRVALPPPGGGRSPRVAWREGVVATPFTPPRLALLADPPPPGEGEREFKSSATWPT